MKRFSEYRSFGSYMNKDRVKRMWLLLALLIFAVCLRLDLFGRPFTEYYGNRQLQNALPIRLFQEGRFNIFSLPTVFDHSYGSAEFPALQWIVASSYQILELVGLGHVPEPGDAGAAETYYRQIAILGRLWSLLMSLLAMVCLYMLLSKAWNRAVALSSLFIYALLPLNRFHDQLFIVEPTLMALSVLSIYLLWEWSENRHQFDWRYFPSALALALVLLLKVSHIFLLLPVIFLFCKRYGACAVHRWPLWFYGLLAVAPAGFFYLSRETHVSGGVAQMALQNTLAIVKDWDWTSSMLLDFWKRHWWIVWTPVGTVLLFWGAVIGFFQRESTRRWMAGLLLFWSLSWLYYWLMAGQLSGHLYYQGPSGLLAAAFMGITMGWIVHRLESDSTGHKNITLIRVGVIVLCFSSLLVYFLIHNKTVQQRDRGAPIHWRAQWDLPPMIAGLAADRFVPPTSGIVAGTIAPLQYPLFYYCHREGWFIPFNEAKVEWETPQEEAPQQLEEYRSRGAEFYVAAFTPDRAEYGATPFGREDFNKLPIGIYLNNNYSIVQEDTYYVIYSLR